MFSHRPRPTIAIRRAESSSLALVLPPWLVETGPFRPVTANEGGKTRAYVRRLGLRERDLDLEVGVPGDLRPRLADQIDPLFLLVHLAS